MKAIVNIGLKAGVLDPAGKAVHHALTSLHFDNVNNVRIGKQIVMQLDGDDAQKAHEDVVKMCEELLANTVIEDYEIEIVS
jgi:phosphoribosylformylglycinamidine synthase